MATSGHINARPRWLLPLVAIVGVLSLVFGIAQPVILRLVGQKPGDSLDAADVISILVTVVALITATAGVFVYELVSRAQQVEIEKAKHALSEQNRMDRAFSSMSVQLFNAANDALRVELLLQQHLPLSPEREAETDFFLEDGISRCAAAHEFFNQCDADHQTVYWQNLIPLQHAFLLACRVYLHGDPLSSQDASRARALIEGLTVATDDTKEMAVWVTLWCEPRQSRIWLEARNHAVELLVKTDNRWLRGRYRAAFGNDRDFRLPPLP